ncbi:MAG: hypothetical protein RBQ88_06380 [Desulfobulbus oligotrophicus]|jgi:hypothetical protein|nr:hypothetical protein [Desulfobulbus oligotrophicus]
MKWRRSLLFGLLAIFLCSCGTTVQESLKVTPSTQRYVGLGKRVVILPFADYSSAGNLETAYRRNLLVAENMTDQFSKYGFYTPVQEDVFLYLVDHNFISVVSYKEKQQTSLDYELNQEWSDAMKSYLQQYADLTRQNTVQASGVDSLGTHGLTQQELIKLGRHFSADYIVRGRILQYNDRQDPTWNPAKKGLLPFVAGVTSKVAFGQAESDKYDELNTTVSGFGDGALISALTDGDLNHALGWGVFGAAMGNMAHHSGKIPQAVVQLRVWVQDAYSGDVVWSNRVDVKTSPESVLADHQHDALFERATEEAISALVDNFAQTVYNVPPPQVRPRHARR